MPFGFKVKPLLKGLATLYQRTIVRHPVVTLSIVFLFTVLSGLKVDQFRLDASADSLVLENDQGLEFYRSMRGKFPSSDDFLLVTFTPQAELFSQQSIAKLRALRDAIEAMPNVSSTNSILSVPLLHSPELTLDTIEAQVRTLDKDSVPLDQVKQALLSNPLYFNLLVSPDAQTTVIQVNLKTHPEFYRLLQQREALREQRRKGTLSAEQRMELEQITTQFDSISKQVAAQQDADVAEIRQIMARHQSGVESYLGGVPMIVSDMIAFVANDLNTFGLGVLAFLLLTLTIIFRQWQWVVLPLLSCAVTVWLEIGYLGWVQWPVTVISSNFVSLLLIITLSMTIHIVVRYREYQRLKPANTPAQLAFDTVTAMAKPCLYMALTTIVAFGSLTLSGIRPVIDFGWMMTIGIAVAYIVAFSILPATVVLLPSGRAPKATDETPALTRHLARFTERHGSKVMLFSLVLAIVCGTGITRLTVENRFIDYFKASTEIYKGMVVVDEKIGGTTPLDVIVDDVRQAVTEPDADPFLADDPFLDDCGGFDQDDAFASDCQPAGEEVRNTWYTYKKMERLEKVHNYLESLPEIGKVLSIATTLKLTQQINQGKKLDALQLAFLPTVFPDNLKGILIDPYLSEQHAKARFNVRLIESSAELNRNTLIKKIGAYLTEELGYAPERIHFTGMAVLYNNMLQSLFDSQIKTLGAVFLAILLMFWLLFRSLRLALIGIAPNLLAAGSVLGLMGWLGVPLDMMTITVASITVGIAVDNTIHYIHRFRAEFNQDRDYLATMYRCHGTIGRAMFYTSLTIVIGFSILTLSNFIPTIYFGLFTGMAMIVALLGSLTLLPQMLIWFEPLGCGQSKVVTDQTQ